MVPNFFEFVQFDHQVFGWFNFVSLFFKMDQFSTYRYFSVHEVCIMINCQCATNKIINLSTILNTLDQENINKEIEMMLTTPNKQTNLINNFTQVSIAH